MAKISGFVDYPREEMVREPPEIRRRHFDEFEKPRSDNRVRTQAARCMDCGVPFCNFACPVSNLIPEFNNFVYAGQWKKAYGTLQSTNNFPEFTGRICPAPCEPACTAAIVESPVAIKQIELAIIEKAFKEGWVVPAVIKDEHRTGIEVAVVGSGPAGLAAAQQLNLAGHRVTVFEKNEAVGGLLMYGIPDFKLNKKIVGRRIDILEREGIRFRSGVNVGGEDYPTERLMEDFDYVCLCCGAEDPRPLDIPGGGMDGVHFAMDFLTQQNMRLNHPGFQPAKELLAAGKHVVVVGGGDTGSDCIGTSIRQGCKSVSQIQLHKPPPNERYPENPWPEWPQTFSTSSSQEEGCERIFSFLTEEVVGENGSVKKLKLRKIRWPQGRVLSGRRDYETLSETVEIDCDLLLVSLGYKHAVHAGPVADLDLETDVKGNVKVDGFRTSHERIFAAGDMVEGANLVVTAIMSGRRMAKALDTRIKGYSHLN